MLFFLAFCSLTCTHFSFQLTRTETDQSSGSKATAQQSMQAADSALLPSLHKMGRFHARRIFREGCYQSGSKPVVNCIVAQRSDVLCGAAFHFPTRECAAAVDGHQSNVFVQCLDLACSGFCPVLAVDSMRKEQVNTGGKCKLTAVWQCHDI